MKVRFVNDSLEAASGKPFNWVFHIDTTDLDNSRYHNLAFCKVDGKGQYGSLPHRTRAQIMCDVESLQGYIVFVSQGDRVKPLNLLEAVV